MNMRRDINNFAAGPFGQLAQQRMATVKAKSFAWGMGIGMVGLTILEWIF